MAFNASEPVEIPGAAIDAAPLVCLAINEDWLPVLIGLCEFMLWHGFWDDASGDIDSAIGQVIDWLATIGECNMPVKSCVISDQKLAGVHGGSSVAGEQRRELNTVNGDTSICELVNNLVRPVAGTYLVEAAVPVCGVGRFQAVVYEGGGGVNIWGGTSGRTENAPTTTDHAYSHVRFVHQFDGVSHFSVYVNCANAIADYGLGFYSNMLYPEVYTQVVLTRLGD